MYSARELGFNSIQPEYSAKAGDRSRDGGAEPEPTCSFPAEEDEGGSRSRLVDNCTYSLP